jgi:hypothetical protein
MAEDQFKLEPPEPAPKKKAAPRQRTPKPKVPAWIVWTRSISAVSVLGGGVGLMTPDYFWFAVCFVYGGLLLLAIDLWFEPQLKKGFKRVGGMIILLLMALFSYKVVFISAPLNIQSLVTVKEYSTGTKIGDIPWRPMYTELDVVVNNPTESDYTNVNIVVRPDYPVAAISQLSNLGGVSFEDRWGSTFRGTIQDLSQQFAMPVTLLATDAGYRIHADHIPPNSSLRIVMAMVAMKKSKAKDKAAIAPMLLNMEPCDFSIEQSLQDKATGDVSKYWYGCLERTALYDEGPTPRHMHISGSYTAKNRPLSIDKEFEIR